MADPVAPAAGSVVIPAWNEAAVIARTLDTLFEGLDTALVEVVVACNGCTDGTEEIVRLSGHPVRLLELPEGAKAAAIRAAEEVTSTLPRLYLDADTDLAGGAAMAVLAALSSGAMAARPPVVYDTGGATWPVRAYYAVRSHLPSITNGLYGAGIYGLSASARARFDEFPTLLADDLFAASIVGTHEVVIVPCTPVRVRVPLETRSLVRTLSRVYRGNRELVAASDTLASSTRRTASELAAMARRPRHLPQVATYVALVTAGRLLSSRSSDGWARDHSAREASHR